MTAETALALPAVILVLVAVLCIVSAAGAQMRAGDAARAAARSAAIGEDERTIRDVAVALGGSAAQVSIEATAPWTTVTVTVPVVAGWLGPLTATGSAVAWTEPEVGR